MDKIKVSKNCYLGVPIRTIKEVYDISNQSKSVVICHTGKYSYDPDVYEVKPASWIMNWQARRLQLQVECGMLHYCVKEEGF